MPEIKLNGYLLDTSVNSAFAPGRPPLSPEMASWFKDNADSLYLSAMTVQEIQKGASKLTLANRGGSRRASDLLEWLEKLLTEFGEKVLPIDSHVARVAGVLEAEATSIGRNPGLADILIAATAKAHDLELLTVNLKHFAPLELVCRNPFE